MKFDLMTVLRNFVVVNDRLYRKYKNGPALVELVYRGRVMSEVQGVRYFGPDVAYACIYKVVPMYPIVQVDGDPLNMAENNLLPARLRRLRYRVIEVPGGFRHPLSPAAHLTEAQCHKDWTSRARAYYQADKPYVRQLEDQSKPVIREVLDVEAPARAPRKARPTIRGVPRPPRPANVAGRVWHWYKGAWINLPEPVHHSDDWMARAEVVLKHPAARFVYDDVAGRTIAVL